MKIPIPFTLLLLGACGFYGCQSDAPKTTPGAPPAVQETAAKPEVFWYVADVDNLRLREAPGLTSTVIKQLKEGEIIEGNGEQSANQDEVELRGISIKAPYYRVTSLTGAQPAGWAFGGALIQVYCGTRAGAPDAQRLSALIEFLKGQKVKSLESGGKAWSYTEQHFSDANGALADAAFIILEQFFRKMEREGTFYNLTESEHWSEADMTAIYADNFDPASNPVTKSLAANGFRIVTSEGAVFPVVDYRKFQAFFAPKTTPSMQAYINQNTAEQNKPMYDDGGIIIPLEELANQAVFWEKFNRANPWFPLRDETRESEKWMRLVLINGSDNTPIFNYETDEIIGEFKTVWEYIQKQYPDTELAKTVKQMTDLCAAEHWKRTKKVDAFREQVARTYQEAD